MIKGMERLARGRYKFTCGICKAEIQIKGNSADAKRFTRIAYGWRSGYDVGNPELGFICEDCYHLGGGRRNE